MRLHIGGLVGDDGVSRCVRLVEAVVGELGEQVENQVRLRLRHFVLHGAVDEAGALLIHFLLDLLTHGAAQKIGFAERVAREHLGDLHHLLLVDDNALRFLEQMVDLRMNRLDFFLAMFASIVDRDVLHRARAIERHQRDDILDAVRPHADQRLAHAGAFHLEHANRFAARQHLIGLRVIERDARQINFDAALLHEIDGDLQNGQGLQAEEVELDEARLLHPFHVELGDRHVGARIAIHRHELRQRTVTDHDTGGVGRGVAIEAFDLLGDVEKPRDDWLLLGFLLQAWLFLDRLGERRRIGRVVRHQLADLVDLAIGHFEHAADVAQCGTRLQRTEGDDLRHLLATILALHVADHLFAPVLAEVDVEVGHRDALGIEEALEQQREAHRIDVGDRQRIGNERPCTRTTARPNGNIVLLRPFDEVGNDQEVAGELHALDNAEFEGQALAILLFAIAGRHAEPGETLFEPLLRLAAQFVRLGALRLFRICGGAGKARQDRSAGLQHERAAPCDLDSVFQRLRQIGKKRSHLLAALEVVVRRQAEAAVVRNHGVVRDRHQGVMGVIVGR
ncbi:hypothetical protein D9M68_275870 [compost metagenome]